jgi:hypothetical protein
MSGIHTTRGAHAHDGPRFSASDRPLPPTEARMTSRARAQLAASIIVVYGLVALAVVAPTATLTLLLAVAVIGAVIGGMFQLADRGARVWGETVRRASRPASHRLTRRDA